MMLINEALRPMVQSGKSKYSIAKELGVQPIMITHYLTGKVRTPNFKVCKSLYVNHGLVVFPYREEELKAGFEQLLMDFDDASK